MDFIDEMIKNIAKEKNKSDEVDFLNFLREELDRKGISLTAKRTNDLHLVPLNASNIIGVELDLSAYDKEKDAKIEEYKKAFESAKLERDKRISEYQNKIDELKQKLERQETVINQIDYILNELFGVKHDAVSEPDKFEEILREKIENGKEFADFLPAEPIKVADMLISAEIQYKHIPIMKALTGEENGNAKIFSASELRQIAEHLLVYCNHAEEK